MRNKLREERFKLRMSQYVLTNLSGVSQSRISLIENELSEPSEAEKKKIAKALKVKISDLFPDTSANGNGY